MHDRTNVRRSTPGGIGGPVDLVVADLSFISLELVLRRADRGHRAGRDLVLMVKPQFEVGKERLGKAGWCATSAHRADAVGTVAAAAGARGWGAWAVDASPLPGPSGNVEFFSGCAPVRGDRHPLEGPVIIDASSLEMFDQGNRGI